MHDCFMYRLSAQLEIVAENDHFQSGPALEWIPAQFTIEIPIVNTRKPLLPGLGLVYLSFWEEVGMKNDRSPRLFRVERTTGT